MLKQTLASEFFALWPTLATVVFVTFSALVGLWLLRPGAGKRYEIISQSILEPDEERYHAEK